jgi:hypothetical protein
VDQDVEVKVANDGVTVTLPVAPNAKTAGTTVTVVFGSGRDPKRTVKVWLAMTPDRADRVVLVVVVVALTEALTRSIESIETTTPRTSLSSTRTNVLEPSKVARDVYTASVVRLPTATVMNPSAAPSASKFSFAAKVMVKVLFAVVGDQDKTMGSEKAAPLESNCRDARAARAGDKLMLAKTVEPSEGVLVTASVYETDPPSVTLMSLLPTDTPEEEEVEEEESS